MDKPFLNPSKNKNKSTSHSTYNTGYCVLVMFVFFYQLGQCSIACNLHQGQTIYSSHDSSGISPQFHYFVAPAPGHSQERSNEMTEDGDRRRVDRLKFPRYSGWLHLKENILIHTRYWCVLSHGCLHYYK